MTTPSNEEYTDSDFLEDVIDIMEANNVEFPKSNPSK
jgi:hypothetical protein